MTPRSAPLRRFVLTAVCAFALPWMGPTSCVFHAARHPPISASTPISASAPAPAETRVGVVRAIGSGGSFVLIETPSALAAAAMPAGRLLHCRPPGSLVRTATADLRVSRERQESMVVANVVAGEPAAGAIVYTTPDTAGSPIPTPGPITYTPPLP